VPPLTYQKRGHWDDADTEGPLARACSDSEEGGTVRHDSVRRISRLLVPATLLWFASVSTALGQACGGVERWAVKMGSDAAAEAVELENPTGISIKDINALPDPRSRISKGDNTTRIDEEKRVFEVKGTLRLFKFETDRDFHSSPTRR
jgi:hypothetical protein